MRLRLMPIPCNRKIARFVTAWQFVCDLKRK